MKYSEVAKWAALPVWLPVAAAGFLFYLIVWLAPVLVLKKINQRRSPTVINTDVSVDSKTPVLTTDKQKPAVINDWSSA